jgi:UDP-glucose 4-epimerase
MAEHLAFAMHATYGLPITVIRYFNVYGPRQNPIFVISNSVRRVLNNLPPLLYDSGEQTRCFTFVDDAVKGTLLAADSDAAIGEAFNIGSRHETTMREIVEKTILYAGKQGDLEPEPIDTVTHYGTRYEDIPRRIPDTTKANEVLGWSLETSVDTGLKKTIEWARRNPWYLADATPPD